MSDEGEPGRGLRCGAKLAFDTHAVIAVSFHVAPNDFDVLLPELLLKRRRAKPAIGRRGQ